MVLIIGKFIGKMLGIGDGLDANQKVRLSKADRQGFDECVITNTGKKNTLKADYTDFILDILQLINNILDGGFPGS